MTIGEDLWLTTENIQHAIFTRFSRVESFVGISDRNLYKSSSTRLL
jgi:hypothetical protein